LGYIDFFISGSLDLFFRKDGIGFLIVVIVDAEVVDDVYLRLQRIDF
jgi:hypothetical protein